MRPPMSSSFLQIPSMRIPGARGALRQHLVESNAGSDPSTPGKRHVALPSM
jgi:hypothetical protein